MAVYMHDIEDQVCYLRLRLGEKRSLGYRLWDDPGNRLDKGTGCEAYARCFIRETGCCIQLSRLWAWLGYHCRLLPGAVQGNECRVDYVGH